MQIAVRIKKIPLNASELERIHNVLWDTYRSPYKNELKKLWEQDIDFEQDRPIDIFFAGTVNKNLPRGEHRELCIDKLSKIGKKFNVFFHQGHLPIDEYFNYIRKAKVVVSPWGNGEWCWRDFEAVYLGAVLLKPDTSFIQAAPDLYQNNIYYVPCKNDFSDLDEKLRNIVKNYEKFMDMRKQARALLIQFGNDEIIVANIVKKIRDILAEYRGS